MLQQELWGNVNIYSNELMVQKRGLPQLSLQTIAFFVGLILKTARHKDISTDFSGRRKPSVLHRTETHVQSKYVRASQELQPEMLAVSC